MSTTDWSVGDRCFVDGKVGTITRIIDTAELERFARVAPEDDVSPASYWPIDRIAPVPDSERETLPSIELPV